MWTVASISQAKLREEWMHDFATLCEKRGEWKEQRRHRSWVKGTLLIRRENKGNLRDWEETLRTIFELRGKREEQLCFRGDGKRHLRRGEKVSLCSRRTGDKGTEYVCNRRGGEKSYLRDVSN